MIIKFKHDAPLESIQSLKQTLLDLGFQIHDSIGESVTIMGVVGDTSKFDIDRLYAYDVVESVLRVQEPFKMVNRKFHPDNTIVSVVYGPFN